MKKSVLAVALVLGVGLVVTCCFDKEEAPQKVEATKDVISGVVTQVKDAAKDAAADVKNATTDAKDTTSKKMAEAKDAPNTNTANTDFFIVILHFIIKN